MKKQNCSWYLEGLSAEENRSLRSQLHPDILSAESPSLSRAVGCFRWSDTNEGYEYWDNVYSRILESEDTKEREVYTDTSGTICKQKKPFPSEKKIIGYKTPHDLFGGRIKKDAIFSKYSPKSLVMYTEGFTTSGVPTEIVKTWEPVYETGMIELRVGAPEQVVTIKNDETIRAAGKYIPWGQFEKIKNTMHPWNVGVLPWSVAFEHVRIGCSNFSKEDILNVWNAFAKLNNKKP